MKKTLLLGALVAAVALTSCNQKTTDSTNANVGSKATENHGSAPKMAYVNMDTLQVKYIHYKSLADQLKLEIEAADKKITDMQKAFQQSYQMFESKAKSMTDEQLQYYGQDLQESQQKITMQQQMLENELMQKQQVIMDGLKVEMDSVLESIRNEHNLDFIFTYPIGSGLLSVNNEFDITLEVTNRLNALRPNDTAAVKK